MADRRKRFRIGRISDDFDHIISDVKIFAARSLEKGVCTAYQGAFLPKIDCAGWSSEGLITSRFDLYEDEEPSLFRDDVEFIVEIRAYAASDDLIAFFFQQASSLLFAPSAEFVFSAVVSFLGARTALSFEKGNETKEEVHRYLRNSKPNVGAHRFATGAKVIR